MAFLLPECKIYQYLDPNSERGSMERTISDESQVCSLGWPTFNCNTRLASSGHRGCISRKASAKAWGVMPPGLCDRFCWAAVTAVICKATRWTMTCRASGLGGEKYLFSDRKRKEDGMLTRTLVFEQPNGARNSQCLGRPRIQHQFGRLKVCRPGLPKSLVRWPHTRSV